MDKYPEEILPETDLYVTVEPCIMCASLLRQYRIRHVYFGCANERFGGTQGVLSLHSESVFRYIVHADLLTQFGDLSVAIDPPYKTFGGVYRETAIMLLRRFYIQENEKGTFWAFFSRSC